MAKKKAPKSTIADEIKRLIDANDFAGAQELINKQVQTTVAPPPPKKKGRPPKKAPSKPVATPPIKRPPAPPVSPPANNTANKGYFVPTKRVDPFTGPRTIEKDGKTYTISARVAWEKPEKIDFKESKAVPHEKHLVYPERGEVRPPAEQEPYQCHNCSNVDYLYPGEGPVGDMLYTCKLCMKKVHRK